MQEQRADVGDREISGIGMREVWNVKSTKNQFKKKKKKREKKYT